MMNGPNSEGMKSRPANIFGLMVSFELRGQMNKLICYKVGQPAFSNYFQSSTDPCGILNRTRGYSLQQYVYGVYIYT